MSHPSGKLIRPRIIKQYPQPRGTSEGFWNSRLNPKQPEELSGGAGFVIFRDAEPDDDDSFNYPATAGRTRQ